MSNLEPLDNNNKGSAPKGGINKGLMVLGLIALAAVFLLPRLGDLLGGSNNQIDPNLNNNVEAVNPAGAQSSYRLGNLVAADSIDRDGCAVEAVSTFANGTGPVYVVAEDSMIPAGTNIFARLYLDGQPVEDTEAIVSDQNYDSTCIYFAFEPDGTFELAPGRYEAEFIVNGNAIDVVNFNVQ